MNNKLITVLYSILIAIVLAFAFKFIQVQDYKLVAIEKLKLLEKAADNSSLVGFIVALISWIMSNYFAIKTKKLFFIWLPLIFITIFSVLFGYHEEAIFKFKQDNGMWNGSFSMSYFFSAFFILLSSILLLINYYIIRSIIRKK